MEVGRLEEYPYGTSQVFGKVCEAIKQKPKELV